MTGILSIKDDYWENFVFEKSDLEYIYNQLLEIEKPMTSDEIVKKIISRRIENEKKAINKRLRDDIKIYQPQNDYEINDQLVFPAFDWKSGKVTGKRDGLNTDQSTFKVIKVEMEDKVQLEFAALLGEHKLNEPLNFSENDPLFNPDYVYKKYHETFLEDLNNFLENNKDIVFIADYWFPKSLLVDVNIGYLNLAEALLEMENGGPLNTRSIVNQIELPTDVNPQLTEFSMNYALQEDDRFDEVGAAGEVTWYLKRLEPEYVQKQPVVLVPNISVSQTEYLSSIGSMLPEIIIDELEDEAHLPSNLADEIELGLIYPHWKSGTLPLCERTKHIFPSAFLSPRVQFKFIDGNSGETFDGWVVQPFNYVYGLKEWYDKHSLIPGTILKLRRGKNPGEVIVQTQKRRNSKDWIRTVMIGTDNSISFAMMKQTISSAVDERMALYLQDPQALAKLWNKSSGQNKSLKTIIINFMNEIIKLNHQGNVHFQELYAAVNLVYRSPVGPILNMLMENDWASHMGDLYFRINTNALEG